MLTLLMLLCCTKAHGDKYAYPAQKLRANGVEKIQITGVKGHVKLKGSASRFYRLKVRHSRGRRYEDWSLAVDRRGHTLVLEVSSAVYGAQWRKLVRKDQWPEFDIELTGPSRPASVSWREGKIEVLNWAADFESSHLRGPLSVRAGVGDYNLQTGDGAVDVVGLAGDLTLKGSSGDVTVEQVTGEVKLDWRSGALRLSGVTGGGRIETFEGDLRIRSCQGDWAVHVARGKADINRCSGKLEAQGDKASWRLRTSVDLETQIKSASGPVLVEWLRGGAKVFLASDSGRIGGPKVKARFDADGRRVAEFRLGQKPFGQVFVQTGSGAISFK